VVENPVKHLSQAEQVERRCLVIYYKCDKNYTRGHNRVCCCIFFVDWVELSYVDDSTCAADQDAEALVFSLRDAQCRAWEIRTIRNRMLVD
jgi:hypothetical protein